MEKVCNALNQMLGSDFKVDGSMLIGGYKNREIIIRGAISTTSVEVQYFSEMSEEDFQKIKNEFVNNSDDITRSILERVDKFPAYSYITYGHELPFYKLEDLSKLSELTDIIKVLIKLAEKLDGKLKTKSNNITYSPDSLGGGCSRPTEA